MTIVTFQSFPAGVDDSNVKSWPIAGHVAAHGSGGPNNQPWGRFSADATTTNGDGNIRVHDWGIAGGGSLAMAQPGLTSWRHIAIRVPSGQTNSNTSLFAGDEMHQSSNFGTTGPAPVNLSHDGIGNRWYYIARGANNQGLAGNSFSQTVFGRASTSNGTLVPFTGGAKTVVADRWTYWLVGTKWDYTGAGWVEIWYADASNTTWANIVPRYTSIYTCYNNSLFPMASLYCPVADGSGTRLLDYANGFYSDDATGAEALTQANSINGFTGSTPTNTALPTIFGTPQVGQTLTGVPGTWIGAPTLTYQWEWDQRSGVWTAVGGATGLSFSCVATYSGAQVRLRETANGTNIVYSSSVTILDPVAPPSNRLAITRSTAGGQRVSAPGNRIAGLGGGGI